MALEALRRKLHGRRIEVLVGWGSPADEIARVALERRVGLIVMGLRGMSGAAGPVRVMALSPTLLLSIPPALATGRHAVVEGLASLSGA